MNDQSLDNLEVFFGEASHAAARVYARLPLDDTAGGSLSGQVVGPECLYAKTLPASFRLVDRGPGPALLAEAIVPDPCFWSPELPFLYRVEIELRRHGAAVASCQRWLGIRPLGARGRHLIYEGKNWVIRGVARELVPDAPWRDWRESMTAMIVKSPNEELLAEASRTGVMVVADLSEHRGLQPELARVGRWPAAVVAIVSESWKQADMIRSRAPCLFAERCSPGDTLGSSHGVLVHIIDADELKRGSLVVEKSRQPVIAQRRLGSVSSVADGRRACDQLQSDLAGVVDCAGYFVV